MDSVNISVNFYNADEEQKFLSNYPDEYQLFSDVAGMSVSIPKEDFLTYFLFRHQFSSTSTTYNFGSFFSQLPRKWAYFEDYFDHKNNTGNFLAKVASTDNTEIPESLGVAGALSLSSRIFLGVTQADWRKIPVLKTKDFDFEHIAATSNKFLVVEAKGSIVQDNSNPSVVSYHKSSILDKKSNIDFRNKYNSTSDVCYGVITVADDNHTLKSWLVDPPSLPIEMAPRRYRLLSRLYYYNDYIRLLSTRSYLSILLPNRLRELQRIADIDVLDKMAIVGSGFEKLRVSEAFIKSRSWFREVKEDQFVTGVIVMIERELFFIGLGTDILNMVVEQSFDRIISYSTESTTFSRDVNCRLDGSYSNRRFFESVHDKKIVTKDGHIQFVCEFQLCRNSSGVVFGRAPISSIK